MTGLILKGDFEMLELADVYEIAGAVYGMAEQAEKSIGCVKAEVEELEEKVSELKENIEALMDDLAPAVADSPE